MAGGSGGRRPDEEPPITGVGGWVRAALVGAVGFALIFGFLKLVGF